MRQPRTNAAAPPRSEPLPAHAGTAAAGPAMEIELKLAVPPAACEAVRRRLEAYGAGPAVKHSSVYFDTVDLRLGSQRCALRVRRIGEGAQARWVQTFKSGDEPGALSRRREWESVVSGPRPQIKALADSPLPQLLGVRSTRLVPVFRTRFERTVRQVRFQGALIEVALDEGSLLAGRRKEPIGELELELKEGSVSAVFDLALDLIGRGRQALALRPAIESKAVRGYRLAQRSGAGPMHADPEGFSTLLQPRRTHLAVARRIVGLGVQRVLANAHGAWLGNDPEYVHQARVALRRTRSALRVLGVATTANDPIAQDLRWMANCFGAMRDWDVLLTQSLPSLRRAAQAGDEDQWVRLMARALARRQRQRLRLRAVLESVRFAHTALRLLRWSEEAAAPTADRLAQWARRAIERGHRRVIAAGRHLPALPPLGRHRLRILAKRQRYALELLAPLLSPGAPARTLKALSRLQQVLGEINDVHVAVSTLPSLTRSRELVKRAERWSEKVVRRNLPKAQARLQQLQRRGSGA
jgi:triphosphatase